MAGGFGGEADGGFGRGFGFLHEVADGVDEGEDLVVVVLEFVLEFGEFVCELLVGGEEFAEFDEGADDEEAGVDGLRAVEDGGGHDGAVFGEGVGERAASSAPCWFRLAT